MSENGAAIGRHRGRLPLAALAALAWAGGAGTIGWVVQAGDSSGGRPLDASYWELVIGYYAVVGVVFGLLDPRHRERSVVVVWLMAIFWVANTILLRDSFGYGNDIEWLTWAGGLLAKTVVVPMVAALLGAYAGAMARGYSRGWHRDDLKFPG